VIFYQWSDIVEQTATLLQQVAELQKQGGGTQALIPELMFLGGLKKWVM